MEMLGMTSRSLRRLVACAGAAILVASLVAGCSAQHWSFSLQSPGERVNAFLQAYYGLRTRGLPQPAQVDQLSVYLSEVLTWRLKRAYAGQRAYAKRFPGDKPPLVDGDLFSSLFEGPTSFAIGDIEVGKVRATVVVNFTYIDPTNSAVVQKWSDRYIAVRVPRVGGWLVEDVEYVGTWDFAAKGKLSEALEYAATYN